jgi:IS605 OrfB family transposase
VSIKPKRLSKSAQRQTALGVVTRVLRIRIKDKHASFFKRQATEVNQVWNYSQDLALKVLEREHRFMSAYDMAAYTKGAAKEGLSLHSQTVQAVSEEYCTRCKQFKRAKLRWRVSRGARRSLGWIPFKAVAIAYRNGQFHYQGQSISLWDSFGLADYTLRSGSFCEDARGRWYVNITVDAKKPVPSLGKSSVGIDLGLKDFAALSDGQKVDAQQFYRNLEPALAVAQRANKKGRVKAIHAKISNRRKDFLHKLSTQLVKEHGAVFVGNVNASGLAQTGLAKSVLDAGWSTFRAQLQYKGDSAGCLVREVNESFSTQTCSGCQSRTGPKGQDGLKVRRWTCSVCGCEHDRDTNAARNILVRGLLELEREFAAAVEARVDETAVNKDSQESGAGNGPLVAGIFGV